MLMGAGFGLQAYGQYQQGVAAKQMGAAQARIAEYNARVAEQEGIAAQKAAEYQARMITKEGKRFIASQEVGYAKGGVLFRGTPLTVLEDTAADIEMDKLMMLREGAIGRMRGESAATISRMQGAAAKMRGEAAYRGSILTGIGTGLTGIGTVGYYDYLRRNPSMGRY